MSDRDAEHEDPARAALGDETTGLGAKAALTDSQFTSLRRLLRKLAGIALSDARRAAVATRLATRLRATRRASYAEYFDWVDSLPEGDDEVREFINSLTTNRTEFFREPEHFELLRERLFPEWERRAERGGVREVRLWSAACSSGEEAYSLAITAREHFGPDWRVEVFATDIDTRVLELAREGVYPAERVERLGLPFVQRHFLRGRGKWTGWFKVRPELARLVRFERLNFIERDWALAGRFDAVFCRNVALYFDRATQVELFRRLHGALADDGALVIGRFERLPTLEGLFEPLSGSAHLRREPRAGRRAG